jgi:uncharacterized protein (TIGR02147 family)
VRNYHRAMLEHAANALDQIAVEDRDVTSLTLMLTHTDYEEFRARIERFRRELLDLADEKITQKEGEQREVFQIGFQLFPLTRSGVPGM